MSNNKTTISKWNVADAKPEHVPQILKLFESIFKKEMPPSLWEWKYGDGRGVGVIVSNEENVIAFYGGMERRVLFEGELIVALQCSDSMVANSHRGTLSKKGPFYLSVTNLLVKYLGHNQPYPLAYGFPNKRAMDLAERLGIYADVGNLLQIVWKTRSYSPLKWITKKKYNLRMEVLDIESADHIEEINRLWSRMADEFKDRLIGVRDLQYLHHRYLDHPTLTYDLHLVYENGNENSIGLIVTRVENHKLILADFIAAQKEFCKLVEFARICARKKGCDKLFGWLTEVDLALIAESSTFIIDTVL